jgi:arsenite methyltransferase
MTDRYWNEDKAREQAKAAATREMVAQRRAILNALDLGHGERVLEIGSGNGVLAREMLEIVGASGHVCGVDSSGHMVKLAEVICPNGQFIEGDATDLPIEDLSFDVVTASQLLCFIPDVDKALSEMCRVLKRGGRLVILDSDWGSLVWNCRDQALMDRVVALLTSPYADAHIPRTLSRRLVATGLAITERRTLTVLNWDRDPGSFSQITAVGFIKPMMESSDDFTDEDWEAWDSDQKATAEAGEYMFSLNRYIFCALKP